MLQWGMESNVSGTENSTTTISTAKDFLGIVSPDPSTIVSLEQKTVDTLLEECPVDIIIDFSSTHGIYQYGKEAAKRKIKIITAISHYGEAEKKFLEELSLETAVFWSPNITLGVNYLLFASSLLKDIAPHVDSEISEEHFKAKAGVSGTAIKIAEVLDVETDNINSVRAGGIVGRHEIIFGFPYQTVRLIHESISREAFGSGALFVAECPGDAIAVPDEYDERCHFRDRTYTKPHIKLLQYIALNSA